MRRSLTILAACAAASIPLAGCSLSGTTHQSAGAGPTDFSPSQVLAMPSGYRNAAIKCVRIQGSWFVVVTSSDGGNGDNLPSGVAVTAAPTCKKYGG